MPLLQVPLPQAPPMSLHPPRVPLPESLPESLPEPQPANTVVSIAVHNNTLSNFFFMYILLLP